MHKEHSSTHLKRILKDIVSIAFQHMGALASELKNLDINESNLKDKRQGDLQAAETMSHLITIINDVIHPAHDMSIKLFDTVDVKEFVEYCQKNQALAIEKKLISSVCKCYSCSLKESK